jgi:hypothetical protein
MEPQPKSYLDAAREGGGQQARPQTVSRPSYVDPMDGYRNAARRFIANLNPNELDAGKTTCYMFYVVHGKLRYRTAVAGWSKRWNQVLANRHLAGIDDKSTTCAEEVLLAQHPHTNFLFSWTYDTGLRTEKRACTNAKSRCQRGCRHLLQAKNIEDLAQ